MANSGDPIAVQREFGLSHSDFYRIFPRVEPAAEQLRERVFRVSRDDGRVLDIEISEEKIRRLGILKIPYIDISFRFTGWSDAQRVEFFEKFDRSFQKGGG